jgi:hypothetical protein
MANLQPSFIKMLLAAPQEPVEQAKTYQCAGCYRPEVKAEYIALLSHGEAYCRACVKEII